MTDFIDRAKLDAEAYERWPKRWESTSDEVYRPDDPIREPEREAFLAGADAYAALLNAETTEEWGVQDQGGGFLISYDEEGQARTLVVRRGQQTVIREVVSRRVLYGPWISSKQGEQS